MRPIDCSARKRASMRVSGSGSTAQWRARLERFVTWRANARQSWSSKRQPRKKPSRCSALDDRRDRSLDVDLGQHLDEVGVRDEVVRRRAAPAPSGGTAARCASRGRARRAPGRRRRTRASRSRSARTARGPWSSPTRRRRAWRRARAHRVVVPGVDDERRRASAAMARQGTRLGHRREHLVHARHQGLAVLEVLDELRGLRQALADLVGTDAGRRDRRDEFQRRRGHRGRRRARACRAEVGDDAAGAQAGGDFSSARSFASIGASARGGCGDGVRGRSRTGTDVRRRVLQRLDDVRDRSSSRPPCSGSASARSAMRSVSAGWPRRHP